MKTVHQILRFLIVITIQRLRNHTDPFALFQHLHGKSHILTDGKFLSEADIIFQKQFPADQLIPWWIEKFPPEVR